MTPFEPPLIFNSTVFLPVKLFKFGVIMILNLGQILQIIYLKRKAQVSLKPLETVLLALPLVT